MAEKKMLNFECNKKEEMIIGISEMPDPVEGKYNLSEVPIQCKKCKTSVFTKVISAHGKTAVNWASWQQPPQNINKKVK